ncbi:MFS transporter [Pseudomonadota bacterium]
MPCWRLSAFYLFFFGSLGALLPYWSLYLKSLGFSPTDIGELMALIMATKIIAPNIWGWVADHTGKRLVIIKLTTLAAAISFAGVFMGQGYWWMAALMCLFSFFWNAALPQFEATTMSRLGDDVHRYSSIRLWGSVGFILAVVVLGEALEHTDITVIPVVIWLLLIGLFLVTLVVPGENGASHEHSDSTIWQALRRKEVIVVLLVCFLLQASHGPYYTFFTIYLELHDYSRGVIGQLWALGVVAEIGVFLVMHRLMPRFGPYMLLLWSLGLTTVRWLLIAWFPELGGVIVFAQCLHAASFGIYHAVAIHLIHSFFVGRHQGRGQALYSSLSFGAGGALGSLGSGYIWAEVSPEATYLAAASISALAMIVTLWAIKLKYFEKNL